MKPYRLSKFEQKQLKQIAKFYGCKVKFQKDYMGGTWWGDHIVMGVTHRTFARMTSIFCHELAHFINWQTKRYPIYHNPKNFGKMNKLFPHYKKMIRYSLNAEILTEKVGAKLCKEWFPRSKYQGYYKNTKVCFEFLYGYYLRA